MQNVLFFTLLIFFTSVNAQQSILKGIVSLHNSELETGKRIFIEGALIRDNAQNAQHDYTDSYGEFRLYFLNLPKGSCVFIDVFKKGLEVVNVDALSSIAGQLEPVKISMAPVGKIADYRRLWYRVGKTAAEKIWEAKAEFIKNNLAALLAARDADSTEINRLQAEIIFMRELRNRIEKQALDLAYRYAPLNLDDATPDFRKAFKLFQNGQMDSSLALLSSLSLYEKADAIMHERQIIRRLPIEANERDSIQKEASLGLIKSFILKADLHRINLEFDSAIKCRKSVFILDPTNFQNLLEYAGLYFQVRKLDSAVQIYQNVLEFVDGASGSAVSEMSIFKGFAIANLANIYQERKLFKDANNLYVLALEIFSNLIQTDENRYPKLYFETLRNYLSLLLKCGKFDETEKMALDAIVKIRIQVVKDSMAYKPILASILNVLGNARYCKNKFKEARPSYEEAFSLYGELYMLDSLQFNVEMARFLNEIARFYATINETGKAEVYYKRSIEMLSNSIIKHPFTYNALFANAYNGLGCLYSEVGDLHKADICLRKALAIYQDLFEKDSLVYRNCLGAVLLNTGIIAIKDKQWQKAESNLIRSNSIFFELAEKNEIFLRELGAVKYQLGLLYKDQQCDLKAKGCFNDALIVFKKLAEKNPTVFAHNVFKIQKALATFHYSVNGLVNAEYHFRAAIEVSGDSGAYIPNAEKEKANLLKSLGQVCYENLNYADAETATRQSINIYRQLALDQDVYYDSILAQLFSNLGLIYTACLNFKKAQSAYEESLKIYFLLVKKDSFYWSDIAYVYALLGKMHMANLKLGEARFCLENADGIFHQISFPIEVFGFADNVVVVKATLAELYLLMHNDVLAIITRRDAFLISRKLAESNPVKYSRLRDITFYNLCLSINKQIPFAVPGY